MKKVKPYLYCMPALIMLLLFIYYPILQNIYYSFLKWDLFSGKKKLIGFSNYTKLFKDRLFWTAIRNNLYFIIISLIFQVVISLIFAFMLENMKNKRISAVFRTTYFLPSLISITIIGLLFTFIYEPKGLLNGILRAVGLDNLAKGWLGDANTAIFAVIAESQWRNIGYTMLFIIVAIQRIPAEITEAAKLDGASKFQTLLYVTTPMIASTILLCSIITTTGGFLVFNDVYVLTAGGPYNSSEVLATIMYENGFDYGKVGYASAIGNIILIFSAIFAGLQSGLFNQKKGKNR